MADNYSINFTDPETGAFNLSAFASDGLVFPTSIILDATAVSANTSLLYYGKGHPNYGERIQENIVHLLENFSGSTAPQNPISGQEWFVRLTYALTGSGYWQWDEGTTAWINLPTNVGPPVVGQVTLAALPPAIVDGAFWVDTSVVPNVLNLGVDNAASPFTGPTWLPREMEDISADIAGNPNTLYFPQLVMRVFDGVEWKNSTNVYTSTVAPQNPSEGDLWFNTSAGQLNINVASVWTATSGAFVELGGDTMTGVLQFGSPSSSLFLWEGAGDDTVAPDVRMTGNALYSSQTDTYFHIDDLNVGTGAFEVAKGTQSRGGQTPLFSVQNDGQIIAEIANYETVILADSDNLTNRTYVDTSDALLAADILTKLNIAGGTMTGFLTLSADPINPLHAATMQYVDAAVGGASPPDGVLIGSNWDADTRLLELFTSLPTTIPTNLVHLHPANEVVLENPSGRVFPDNLGVGPDYLLHNILNTIVENHYQRIQTLESAADREVIEALAAVTDITLTDMEYQVGTNHLDVFVNGVKSYGSERAYQGIDLDILQNLSYSSQTGLGVPSSGYADATNGSLLGTQVTAAAAATYDFDVTVDGGGLQTLSVVLAGGEDYSTIAALMSAVVVGGSVSYVDGNFTFRVTSATTGATSTATIAAGTAGSGGGDLFAALDAAESVTHTFPAGTPGSSDTPGFARATNGSLLGAQVTAAAVAVYDFDVNIDGAGLQTLSITTLGSDTYTALAALMNAEVFGGTVVYTDAIFGFQVTSNTTGVTSTATIAAGTAGSGGGDLFAALDAAESVTHVFPAPTGGTSDSYDLDIDVDGGGIATMTATGSDLATIQDIVDQINLQITTCTAEFDYRSYSIRVHSNSQGTGSSIDITDGSVNGMLSALAARTGSSLPIYVAGSISPPAGGPITTITRDLGYIETDSGFVGEAYGVLSSYIQFNAALTIGDFVEVINRATKL